MLKAIVVVDENWNIGKNGNLLANLPKDLKQFKKLTKGQFIIMGRKTLESLPRGKPLPERVNIILTRDKNYTNKDVIVVNSFDDLFDLIKVLNNSLVNKDFLVCGGGEIYKALLDKTEEVIVTKIHHKFKECDTQFPNLDESREWEQKFLKSEKDGNYTTSYIHYKRK